MLESFIYLEPVVITNNLSGIAVARNLVFRVGVKHIMLRHYFITRLVENREVQLNVITTNEHLPKYAQSKLKGGAKKLKYDL